ncbi:IRC25 (YLR021W) [Zygosaccharomyces parabailii]|nr:IRC25 (YLR021W) [Zygosaccharomyces parabailii]
MYCKDFTVSFPSDILPATELTLHSVHFSNKVLLQIRCNGEMDTTYEVVPKGLQPLSRPLAGLQDEQEEEFSGDHMADWQVICRLGDSNDTKLPVICTQIGELYR